MKSPSYLSLLTALSFFSLSFSYAQLGFCTGNSGGAIFTENFGAGTTDGPALPNGFTTYNYTNGTPSDGSYTISSTTDYYDWHNTADHTPNDNNGKMLVVNASYTAGEFYRTTVSGLCENTSYEFSAFLLNFAGTSNVCGGGLIPVNVKFQIWDDTNTNLLATGDTGNLGATGGPIWKQYGLVFKTEPGQTSVILKMINNGDGGCGNDLAIDDIVFKSCGDFISLTNDTGEDIIAQCEADGIIVSTTLTATPDFSIYSSHAYQWQLSSDYTNWTDIEGETANTFITPTLDTSRYFRVKVAEDQINISNALCNVVSDVFSAIIVPIAEPPVSNGDIFVCADMLLPLTVSVPSDQVVNWYDDPIGGNLLAENSTSFFPPASGTYYTAASSNLTDCFSNSRTALEYTIYEVPQVTDESLLLCENIPIMLHAGISNVTYQWSTGETSENIEIMTPGTYTMTATNSNGCSATKTITVQQIDQPLFDTIISSGEDIIITTKEDGDYEYALNNDPFQNSPIFRLVAGGLYLIQIRSKNDCPIVSQEFHHFVVPKFFSPNGDSYNDVLLLQGLEFFSDVEVQIFDRYGLLILQSRNTSFTWDGTYNGSTLPASDYWYRIKADDLQFKGHFALKR